MVPLHELQAPIQEEELLALQPALANVQGNILRGHGRSHAVHILLTFKAGKSRAKRWLRRIARRVTSACQQRHEADVYRQHGLPGQMFCSLLLSAEGYRYLGLDLTGHSPAFIAGMQHAGTRLNDPPVETWEAGYQQTIHAMVLLADNDEAFLLQEIRQLIADVDNMAHVRAIEHGRVLRNASGDHIEHFGYVNGRSQPLFFQKDLEREHEVMDGIDQWNPAAGPHLVFAQDPHGAAGDCGSYLVFRKLEQNVQGFKKQAKALATALGVPRGAAARAGALMVGRFEDGTPVVLRATAGRHMPVPNNFTFVDDPAGVKCPFQAHIRTVNPRGELSKELGEPDNIELQHRIARRGIPYGKRIKEPKDNPRLHELPTAGVGLLFLCYQRDIASQFEFLQAKWVNNEDFLHDGTGCDAMIGQTRRCEPQPQVWPGQWGRPQKERRTFRLQRFVTLQGGEYFFAPSINFLRTL